MNTTAAHHVLLPEDYADDTGIIFGQSQFKGRTGWAPHLHRWVVQYISLLIKNFLVMVRRPVQSSMFMLLPAAIVLVFLIEQNPSSSSSAVPITVPVDNLGECNVAHTSNCVRVVYSPESEITTPIMNRFSEINQLQVGKDVLPFSSISSAREYVASNLGTVQFTLFFRNESLWETEQYSPTEVALAKNLSYTVFHNTSISDKDSRSKEFGMSFPLMVLQKTLEQAYLETFFAGQYQGYSVNYGQSTAVTVTSNSSSTPTACQKPLRSEFSNLTTVMMWVQMFAFLMLSNVTLQLIGEERRKHLFNSLRRLGLLDTAYWLSWFTTFLVFLSLGCCIAMIVAVIVRAKSSTLRDIDLGLLFLQLWMSGCAYISFSMSLGALCSSQSIATAISLTVFVVALITVAASSTTLNSYGVFYDFESNVVVGSCKLITSSYNFVYSDTLPAHTFVQFLVYWLPWFHSSQAMSNILSLVQVDGQSVGMADATTNIKLVTSSGSQFDSRWIAWSYYMMLLNGLLYLITSWLAGQLVSSEGTEGRNIFSVLLPSVLRNYIFSKGEVIEGDVRGEQRSMSIQEGSIRAYKVSKTFSGVQAVKEVSFSLSRGQVSCLLGHNGAGKSTLINMVTGLMAPTHGSIFVKGFDVETEFFDVQQMMGVCPQHDLLWDNLTAREHMHMFAAFKGLRWGQELATAVDAMLSKVELLARADNFAGQYSGGMKRRLSVALSTVGDVEVIILDEPTTGLDPLSRRRVWETINELKRNRIVILTTHNMEEADFLGDTIIIMHGGKVKALGDPLFLKQTYGRGYQINLVVELEGLAEVQQFLVSVLPGSQCQVDSSTGFVSIDVQRDDIRGLPRLFKWLEQSRNARRLVREWGISNTTLEQVFLMLCIQNTEVNYVERREDDQRNTLCPMCRQRQKTNVLMRNVTGSLMIVPSSLCGECANGNTDFTLPEDTLSRIQDDFGSPQSWANLSAERLSEIGTKLGKFYVALVEQAQSRAEQKHIDRMMASEGDELQHLLGDGELKVGDGEIKTDDVKDSVVAPAVLLTTDSQSQMMLTPNNFAAASFSSSSKGSPANQIYALAIKNVQLQYRQRCSNCCSVFFVGIMFLLLYLISIILQAPSSLTQCSSGYLSTEGCDLSTLEDHIFSGAETTISSFGGEDYDPVPLNSDGYAIQNYLVPTSDRSSVAFFGKSPNYDFRDCCLPVHEQRNNIVWNSFLANEDLLDYSASTGLEIDVRNIPAVASGTEAGANDFQIANQNNVQKSLISSEGTCPYDNSATPLKNYTYQQNLQNFSSLFSDAALSCPSCVAQAATASGSVFFNGTLWVSKSDDNGCASFYCTIYPFAFLDFLASANSTADFILSTFGCEQVLGAFRKDPSYEGKNQTILSMTYMNLLTNMLISPSLNTYEAQGSFSQYGYLDFNPNAISQFQAFLLTLFAMMLLNGFWPIAVWRLAHERGNALVGMMQTVGLGPITYLCGMYLFDMMIAVFAGILMVIFAVYLNLSRFKDAPVGLLIAVVLCSAHALTAMSLLLTKVADSQASLLSLVAACMVVGMAVCTALVCIIVYPNDGEWPNAMSILPFFAQGRALYIILVYHRTSSEVDAALGLLFAFGVFCFGCCCALEKQHELLNLWDSIFFNYENAPKVLVSGAALDGGSEYEDQNQSLTGSRQLSDIESANTTSNRLVDLVDQLHDEDLAMEKNKAMAYAPSTNANYAIFTQELTHYFPPKKSMNFFSMFSGESTASSSGHYAVKGVSMALSLGECFGLLGPNGAGKSTTISILSGKLKATRGNNYVAGVNISKDISTVHKNVGICPQFDVFWGDLTVKEHLYFQARQRGVFPHLINAKVQQAAIAVGLDGDGYATKAANLSGGMRRRLSIAMSLIGDPPIIFMDEPTTGLDPDNRQMVWHIIQRIKQPNRLILLTTHSMEEAEALCTRIGIMAKGQLRCIGSSQHLKSKYGKGFTLTLNLLPCASPEGTREQQERVDGFIVKTLSNGQGKLLSAINRTRKFLIPKKMVTAENILINTDISEIFRLMEANKAVLKIREWGLSLTTLEEVFISAVE